MNFIEKNISVREVEFGENVKVVTKPGIYLCNPANLIREI